ncbi:MAG TPA: MCE family protein [Mycobacterium sp.]|jgi:phospholipid/cholesterol/gamma-HCH transport system substrate-binding protein
MIKYRGGQLIRAGFIGVVLILLVIAVGLQPQTLKSLASSIRYQALFTEAGGLAAGNPVLVSGMKVGTVSGISLKNGEALVTFNVPGRISLGSETTVHIRTGTLLGERVLTLESAGSGKLRPNDVIPISRTGSPYSLTEAVSDLSSYSKDTDFKALNQSLDTLSDTLNQIAPQLGPAFDGITRLSRSLNERNDSLRDLLKTATDVTGILSERSQQINTLILDANDLVGVLADRRNAIVSLLANTSAVAKQLTGLVHDNEAKLAPALERLNRVNAMLEKNRDNIGKALPGLKKFQITQGEAVGSGYYYDAFIPNLDVPEILQPFFDYIFGFRRGVNAGQPPDNAGPRATLPFPYNGIPQPQEQWGPGAPPGTPQ